MKTLALLFAAVTACPADSYVNFIRQKQQDSNVVWDMPVPQQGAAPSALLLETSGALFQLFTINETSQTDYLLDQKLVGTYLPSAAVKVTTLDPYQKVTRTRVDKPFTVEIEIGGLMANPSGPAEANQVRLERHLGSYEGESHTLDASALIHSTPAETALLDTNTLTRLEFSASSVPSKDPLKAKGEEHFTVFSAGSGELGNTQLATGFVQVWPVATGEIKGIEPGQEVRFDSPALELILHDLYPRSDTHLILYKGEGIHGQELATLQSYSLDQDHSQSTVIPVDSLDKHIVDDGTYTLALVTDTVFGRDLLAEMVTFVIHRNIHVNAMQVDMTEHVTP